MMMLRYQLTLSRTDMPTSSLVSFLSCCVCAFLFCRSVYKLSCVCLSVDDFSRVKISRVDKKEDDTDYINATHIDVR